MEDKKLLRKKINGVGIKYAIYAYVGFAVQMIIAYGLRFAAGDFVNKHETTIQFIMTLLLTQIFGFLLIFLLTLKADKVKLERQKLGFGKFIQGVFMVAAICFIGGVIGAIINLLLTVPFGLQASDSTAISDLVLNGNPILRTIVVAITAPIFEELIFRKVLCDCLGKYSKFLAIVASGLMFGLYHGNFSQGIFAAGIGMFFAYVYLKTGNILYTIGYHMIVNTTTSVFTLYFSKKVLAYDTEEMLNLINAGNQEAVLGFGMAILMFLIWMAFLACCGIAGVVIFIINRKKFKINETEGAPTKKEAIKYFLTSPGFILFLVFCVYLFIRSYVFPMLF